jgi:flagellin-like protein
MKLCRTLKHKRGISPLIATIILLAICIAGGALIYSIFFSTANTLNATGQLSVQTSSLIKDTQGHTVFTMTIKNVGTKPFTSLSVTLASEAPGAIATVTTTTPLQPGQSVSYVPATALDGSSYIIGNSYNVIIRGTTTDGSIVTQAVSVTCTVA